MKNQLKTLAFVIIMVTGLTSCKDFLTEEPKGQLASLYYWQSAADLDGAINGLYGNLRATFASEYSNGANLYAGDDIDCNPIGINLGAFSRYDNDPTNLWLNNIWQNTWKCIKNCNFIINGAPKVAEYGVSKEEIDFTLAIAHYWRAYFYFYLVRSWGAVPIMLEAEIDYNKKLNSMEEVYDLIVSDLKIAEGARINYDKVPYVLNGRNTVVGKAGAKATLAYVYMAMAGWPLNKGTEYYQLAAAKAKEVIDGVENGTYNYALYDEHWKIYSVRPEYNYNHIEVLNAVYYNRDTGGQGNVCADYINEIADGWGNSNAEIKFWCDYPEGPRKQAAYFPKMYLIGLSDTLGLLDWWYDTNPPKRLQVRPCFMRTIEGQIRGTDYDWTDPGKPHSTSGDKIAKMVLLSEVYLWYAEALGRSGQTNQDAVNYVNMIRNRADGFGCVVDRSTVGIPEGDHVEHYTNIYPAGMTAEELAEAAYDEHGWEIAGNYAGTIAGRYWDMHRMYRVKAHFEERVRDPEYEVAPGVFRRMGGTPTTGSWSDDKMWLPYPADDVMLNPNLNN
ncbi:MAG: RagB/SusD family nutrient uptake outer membrane protein [Marinilabiliaceae bacterium]|nr:RagB/SusD family nutrient uptake outer membrane protein [Marinilabiliaceae bacterium]